MKMTTISQLIEDVSVLTYNCGRHKDANVDKDQEVSKHKKWAAADLIDYGQHLATLVNHLAVLDDHHENNDKNEL